MINSETKKGFFSVYYRKDGAWWFTVLPTVNCMKTTFKWDPACDTKKPQKNIEVIYDSRPVSIKDGVIKMIKKLGKCDVDHDLKLNGHNSTLTTTYGGPKCNQFEIDTYSKKNLSVKLCEGKFDRQQHVNKTF